MKLFEGKVYMITSKETEKIYIGSTTQTLKKRFGKHISNRKKGTSCSAIEIMKYPDCEIHLLDRLYVTQPKSDRELLKLEGKYQLINKDICVNKRVSKGLTHNEHNRLRFTDPELRTKMLKQNKEWYERNKGYRKQYKHFNRTSFFGQLCKLYKIYN